MQSPIRKMDTTFFCKKALGSQKCRVSSFYKKIYLLFKIIYELFKTSMKYYACDLWNSLPGHIKSAENIQTFRSMYKRYINTYIQLLLFVIYILCEYICIYVTYCKTVY